MSDFYRRCLTETGGQLSEIFFCKKTENISSYSRHNFAIFLSSEIVFEANSSLCACVEILATHHHVFGSSGGEGVGGVGGGGIYPL